MSRGDSRRSSHHVNSTDPSSSLRPGPCKASCKRAEAVQGPHTHTHTHEITCLPLIFPKRCEALGTTPRLKLDRRRFCMSVPHVILLSGFGAPTPREGARNLLWVCVPVPSIPCSYSGIRAFLCKLRSGTIINRFMTDRFSPHTFPVAVESVVRALTRRNGAYRLSFDVQLTSRFVLKTRWNL